MQPAADCVRAALSLLDLAEGLPLDQMPVEELIELDEMAYSLGTRALNLCQWVQAGCSTPGWPGRPRAND
jgi:hypothetical protein